MNFNIKKLNWVSGRTSHFSLSNDFLTVFIVLNTQDRKKKEDRRLEEEAKKREEAERREKERVRLTQL